MRRLIILLFGALVLTPVPLRAASRQFEDQVRPFLVRHCQECHGAVKPKGDFRLGQLSVDFGDTVNRERWLNVRKRLQAGEMPPKSNPRPPEKDIRALTEWISTQVETAETARRAAQGRVVLRRLNRAEY